MTWEAQDQLLVGPVTVTGSVSKTTGKEFFKNMYAGGDDETGSLG